MIKASLSKTILVSEELADECGVEIAEWVIIRQVQDRKTFKLISVFVDLDEAISIASSMETEKSTIIIGDLKGRKLKIPITDGQDYNVFGSAKPASPGCLAQRPSLPAHSQTLSSPSQPMLFNKIILSSFKL